MTQNDPRFSLITFPDRGISLMHWNSKTVWGGIIAGLSQLIPLLQAGTFGPKAQAIGTAVGIILGAVGVRSAIANGPSVPPDGQSASQTGGKASQ